MNKEQIEANRPERRVNRMIDPETGKLRRTRGMSHPKSGQFLPVPDTKAGLEASRSIGFCLSTVLINTATGTPTRVSEEASVQNGEAVLHTLNVKRAHPSDPHVGKPAFMRVEDWHRLPQADRIALLWAPASTADEAPESDPALALALAQSNARELAMRDELERLRAQVGKRKE